MLVVAKPNVIDRSKGVISTTFAVNGNVTLHVGLYTVAGELTRVADGGAGTGQVSLDASALANGLYLAVVDIQNPNGGIMARQTLKILVLH